MERLDEAEDLVLCTMNPWMMLKLLRRLCAIPKLMEDGFGLTTQSPSALIPQPLEFTWGGPHIQGVVEEVDVGTTEEVDTVVDDEIMTTTVVVVGEGDMTDIAENLHLTEKDATTTDADPDPDLTHLDEVTIKYSNNLMIYLS